MRPSVQRPLVRSPLQTPFFPFIGLITRMYEFLSTGTAHAALCIVTSLKEAPSSLAGAHVLSPGTPFSMRLHGHALYGCRLGLVGVLRRFSGLFWQVFIERKQLRGLFWAQGALLSGPAAQKMSCGCMRKLPRNRLLMNWRAMWPGMFMSWQQALALRHRRGDCRNSAGSHGGNFQQRQGSDRQWQIVRIMAMIEVLEPAAGRLGFCFPNDMLRYCIIMSHSHSK